jgi:glutamate synthase domain-containing protein 2
LTGDAAERVAGMNWARRAVPVVSAAVAALAAHDLLQRGHTLLRNFPVVGRARYLLEAIGPELRQYIVAGNNEERPFTRDQRRWIYASAKKENNYEVELPCTTVLGGTRGRARAFRPGSVVNISGMSFGSLSGKAVEALNRGAAPAGCLQDTGEGGLSPYHRNGGELVFQGRHRILRVPAGFQNAVIVADLAGCGG